MSEPLTFSFGMQTDVGQQRSHNEDAVRLLNLPGAQAAFVLCDGMGGLRAGDVASTEAVRTVEAVLAENFAGGVPSDPLAALNVALTSANAAVNGLHFDGDPTIPADDAPTERAAGATNPAALMGTTCVAGVVLDNTLYLAHAGDSRAYLYRAGRLTRLTDDHSYVAERVRAGDITEAEARVSRFRNVITRAIGIDSSVKPDLRREALQPGDTVLVCSDGLTTMVEDPQIADLLRANGPERGGPERAASALIDAANRSGGHDNVTVLLLRAGGQGESPESPTPAGDAFRAAPVRKRPTALKGGVMDMDAPRRRGGASPVALLFLGAALAIIGLTGAVGFLPGGRVRAAALLVGHPPAPTTTGAFGPAGSMPDYAHLQYAAPIRFSDLLARGDLLSYSKTGGLLFVREGTGAVMTLSRTAQPIHPALMSVDVLSAPAEVPSTHIFLTNDAAGDVYISRTKTRVVEKRAPDGQLLQTLRGFDKPEAIVVDEDGNLYVVDYNLIKILRALPPSAKGAAARPSTAAKPASPAVHRPGTKK
jgi:serine/threonine protein phosphatase PrpC